MDYVVFLWLALCLILIIAEVSTLSFVILPFALGAAITALFSLNSNSTSAQLIIYLISSGIFLTFIPSCARKLTRTSAVQKGAIDRFQEEIGVITRENSESQLARISILQEEWLCRGNNESYQFKLGEQVKVVAVDGTKLVVEAVNAS